MDLSQIPYDMSFSFGNDLRETPIDPESMRKGIVALEDLLKTPLPEEKKFDVKHTLGVYLRIQNQLTKSKDYLQQCLKYYSDIEDEVKILICKIRLAHTLQWNKKFSRANSLLNEALKLSQSHPRFIKHQDFVLQHFGKLRYDQGLYKEAEDFFNRALFLRKKKGVSDLIHSTEFSLKVIKRLTL